MKIALVSPTWTEDFGVFASIAKKRNSQPPLGLLYLASVARARGHEVRVVDADVENYSMESLAGELASGGYALVGVTATSPVFHKAEAFARRLKEAGFSKPVIAGGEHLNIFKAEAFPDCFDFAFYGESDRTFDAFLAVLEKGGSDFSSLKGLVYREGDRVVQTPPAPRIENLDELAFPAMDLLKLDSYVMTFAKFPSRRYLPIMATRGCPFKCVYCSEPLTNPHVRFRSPGNIVDEMEKFARELDITHFFFMDSNLTLRKDHTEGVCREILRRGLKLTFEGWTRANMVDRDILSALKEAGLIRISYGIESGDPEILRIIRKEVSLDDMREAFRLTEELGIEPACSVMLGLPGETRASAERTIAFVNSIPQILYANFSIANPYPGTEMYDWARTGRHGIRLKIKDFSQYKRYDSSPITVNDLDQEDLVRLQKIGLLKIHLRPRRMLAAVKMLGLASLVPAFLAMLRDALRLPFSGRHEKKKEEPGEDR